jgi:hypothetical protein
MRKFPGQQFFCQNNYEKSCAARFFILNPLLTESHSFLGQKAQITIFPLFSTFANSKFK